MHVINKHVTKRLVRLASHVLPEERGLALERWRRGREEYWKYQRCDHVFASYGKSGRTWVRAMLSRYFQLACNIPENILFGFDNYHKLNPAVPKIFFTHDNYLRTYTGNLDSKKDFYAKKTVLLARRPQDVAVSQFFQWKHRMRPYKKALNLYPSHGADISLYDFVMDEHQGLPHIIEFMNLWERELPNIRASLLLRYEDLRATPHPELSRLVAFLGMQPDAAAIADAVEFATVENLRKKEETNYFWRSGSRLKAADPSNPDSYKVRRAKVGGYRDYFDDRQLAEIDGLVAARLAPSFGYSETPAVTAPRDAVRD